MEKILICYCLLLFSVTVLARHVEIPIIDTHWFSVYWKGVDGSMAYIADIKSEEQSGSLWYQGIFIAPEQFSESEIIKSHDAQKKTSEDLFNTLVKKNPWIIGEWGLGDNVDLIIKEDGSICLYDNCDITIQVFSDKKDIIDDGDVFFEINWKDKTIMDKLIVKNALMKTTTNILSNA